MSFPGLMCKVVAIDNQPLMVVPAKEKQKNNQPSTINPRQSTSMGNISGKGKKPQTINKKQDLSWSSLFSNCDGNSKGKTKEQQLSTFDGRWAYILMPVDDVMTRSRRLRFWRKKIKET